MNDPSRKTAIPLIRREASIVSPLRYPGAKRRLCGYIREVLRLNSIRPKLFVEPFAGGANVALDLLSKDLVNKIALGERDPLLASFWKVVFRDPGWLIRRIKSIPVTLEKWNYFKANRFRSDRARALSCIFLNRTSFSGILAPSAGPIGGQSQSSDYKVDCRFPVQTLVRRIEQAAALSDRVVFVHNADWQKTIEKVNALGYKKEDVFYYFDPPFYEKADRLYTYYFMEKDHRRLHDALATLQPNWLLSYDAAKPIIRMYSSNGTRPRRVSLLYSAAASGSRGEAHEIIVTDLPNLPKQTRLWRTSKEWRSRRGGVGLE